MSAKASMLQHVEKQRGNRFSCIHVMDREADIIEVLLDARRLAARFVIRSAHDRALHEGGRLRDRIAGLKPCVRKQVQLNARGDRGRPGVLRKRHPKRSARTATLGIAACAVELSTGWHNRDQPPVAVNVVHVRELDPPRDEPPVDWLLFIPVAWRLLLARSLARSNPSAPARVVLTPIQLRLLTHQLHLDAPPATLEQATYAVARLGGHLPRNGPPGWQTLGRGFEALLLMQDGWRAAVEAGAL
jgi:hypothetical protein